MNRVLLVDDDPQIVRAIRVNLTARGYTVSSAYTGRQALAEAVAVRPDVVVLDLGLPDLDGVAVITDLRRWTPVPIVVLSGRAASGDKVEALDAGADDYVTKPFDIDELVARIRAVSRRTTTPGASAPIRLGHYLIDLDNQRITPAAAQPEDGPEPPGTGTDHDVHLTPTQWRLLDVLVRNPGRLISQQQLLPRSGDPTTRPKPITSANTWPSCATSSNPTPPTRGISSPNPAWATDTSPERVGADDEPSHQASRPGLFRHWRCTQGGCARSRFRISTSGGRQRYVREWANGLAAAGYLDYAGEGGRTSTRGRTLAFVEEASPAYVMGGLPAMLAATRMPLSKAVAAFRTGDGIGWHEHDPDLFQGGRAVLPARVWGEPSPIVGSLLWTDRGETSGRGEGRGRRLRVRRGNNHHGRGLSEVAVLGLRLSRAVDPARAGNGRQVGPGRPGHL